MDRKYVNLNKELFDACLGGYKELVLLSIKKGANKWNWGLEGACEGGHKELALLMIEKGAYNWNEGLRIACFRGHKELAVLMIEKGADECYLLTTDYCICLFHIGVTTHVEKFNQKIEKYKNKRQTLIVNYEDYWLRMLLSNYL